VFFFFNAFAYMEYHPFFAAADLGFYAVFFLFTRVEIFSFSVYPLVRVSPLEQH